MRVTGTISCDEGRRFRIRVTVAQGDNLGQRLQTGTCTGQPQRFRLLVAARSGQRFLDGNAQVDVVADIGVPGERTIEDTFTASSEITIDIPGGIMGQVVAALVAMERLQQ